MGDTMTFADLTPAELINKLEDQVFQLIELCERKDKKIIEQEKEIKKLNDQLKLNI